MGVIRFLHTADWQLGMQRHFLSEEAAPRFAQARIDVLREIGRVARERECAFVVAAGDLFESNHVDRRTVARTLDALASIEVPVYLLPGNHDPLDAASVFRSREFTRNAPRHVHLLDSADPVAVATGVEVVGVPWPTKKPRRDLVADALARLEVDGVVRVCIAHGIVDALAPDRADPDMISMAPVMAALDEGRIHFLALGDRHSATRVEDRAWYSGAPEPTAYGELDPGRVLIVELEGDRCDVERVTVGRWRFEERSFELDSDETLDGLEQWIEEQQAKDTTILKLRLRGALNLRRRARLDALIERSRELFAGLEERLADLDLLPDELDLEGLGFEGLGLASFARATVEELAGEGSEPAREALALLYRLAGDRAP